MRLASNGISRIYILHSSSSKGFNARVLPPGYVFSSGGNCTFVFSEEFLINVLAVLNSEFGDYLLKLINQTINFPVGTVASVPIPENFGTKLELLPGSL